MSRLEKVQNQAYRRTKRTRQSLRSTESRPRLSVFVSNRHVVAQIIDDTKNHTIAYSSTADGKAKGTLTEKAVWVGGDIAKKAKSKKVTAVVFDRGSKQYHGRIKALADAAREGGLEF